ncbi:BNR-4 repeat-containing protein [Micromonospora sp. BQ11]|uniref:BNR-4 repeat-containing protein n=1 Tax=Micromonospora sp. BQ11 TaxID=3452212 RepID=UPI003F8ABD70
MVDARQTAGLPRRLLITAAAVLLLLASCPGSQPAMAGAKPSAAQAAGPVPRTELASSGAWCWFADPRGVYYHGTHRRTYLGFITSNGEIRVAMYDHATGHRTTSVVTTGFQIDDHNNPAIVIRPDRRVVVFWSAHGGSAMYYRRSAKPEDVSAWEPIKQVPTNTAGGYGYTYPNPVQLSGENNRLYLFWRGGDFNPAYSTTNGGDQWTTATRLISSPGHRPYLKVAANGRDTIHFAFTEAHPRNLRTSIYYMYYRAGSLYRADGTRIGPMGTAVTPAQATKVYDAATHGAKAWVHDIAIDSSGHPVITYATFPTDADHRYRYARWTGTGWFDRELTAAGGTISGDPAEPNYSGGITLDHDDPSVVLMSRQVDGVFEIERWTTPDGGTSWSTEALTSGSTEPNMRPFSPWGLPRGSALDVVWMAGDYPSYTRYRTRMLRTGTGPGGNTAPTASFTAAPVSGDPRTVAFDARGSADPDGTVASWSWTFGDGTTATGATPRHRYAQPGRYFVTLRVTDTHPTTPASDVLVREVVVTG